MTTEVRIIPNTSIQTFTLCPPKEEGQRDHYLVYVHDLIKDERERSDQLVVKPLNLSDIEVIKRAKEINEKFVASISFQNDEIHVTINKNLYPNLVGNGGYIGKYLKLIVKQKDVSFSIGNVYCVTNAEEERYNMMKEFHSQFTREAIQILKQESAKKGIATPPQQPQTQGDGKIFSQQGQKNKDKCVMM